MLPVLVTETVPPAPPLPPAPATGLTDEPLGKLVPPAPPRPPLPPRLMADRTPVAFGRLAISSGSGLFDRYVTIAVWVRISVVTWESLSGRSWALKDGDVPNLSLKALVLLCRSWRTAGLTACAALHVVALGLPPLQIEMTAGSAVVRRKTRADCSRTESLCLLWALDSCP